MSEFSFNKQERLKSRKAISMLFEKGHSLYFYPIRILYSANTGSPDPRYSVKCGFSVSKKNFRRAVDRNLLKRRMREVWRLNKSSLLEKAREKETSLNVFVIYAAKELEGYAVIERGVIKGMEEVKKRIESIL